MVNKDGKFTYSAIVKVDATNNSFMAVYSNPIPNQSNISLSHKKSEKGVIEILDMMGKVIANKTDNLVGSSNKFLVTTSTIANGCYRIVVKGNSIIDQKKFIKYGQPFFVSIVLSSQLHGLILDKKGISFLLNVVSLHVAVDSHLVAEPPNRSVF